jgi:HD-like signal output (HDOD) protein
MLQDPEDMMLHQMAQTMLEAENRLPILPKLFADFIQQPDTK